MSVSNLLAPNNYELYINTLHVNNLKGATGTYTPYISPLYTNYIDTPATSQALALGTLNANIINIGNTIQSGIYCQIYCPTYLPSPVVNTPYLIADSRGEQTIRSIDYTGTFTASGVTGQITCRRIGNWVDLYYYSNYVVSSGATFNNALLIANVIPPGYLPANTINAPCTVIVNTNLTVGICSVDTSGNLRFGLSGIGSTLSFTGGNYNVGAINFAISYPVI